MKSFSDFYPVKDSSRDEEFNIEEKKTRKSDYYSVDLPRDLLASLEVTGTLYRSNISDRTAMQVISSVLRTIMKDRKQVDLNEFVLSRKTIGRRR